MLRLLVEGFCEGFHGIALSLAVRALERGNSKRSSPLSIPSATTHRSPFLRHHSLEPEAIQLQIPH
jgi:hypothetical protein